MRAYVSACGVHFLFRLFIRFCSVVRSFVCNTIYHTLIIVGTGTILCHAS